MRKSMKNCILLCTLLALTVLCVFAVSAEETEGLHIQTTEEFLAFAESCRLDSFSKDLNVYLDADLDLSSTHFTGIPIFCGNFYGNSHTISGFTCKENGSIQGFFRQISENALVQELTVKGTVTPTGSRNQVGGIAGTNSGTIRGCTFEGEVSGGDSIGGIAGTNLGTIEGCHIIGNIHGNHFAGGIAGNNSGILKDCVSDAQINTTVQENRVSLSDININNVLGTEAPNTVTDIGGIAGISTGVIRSCRNQGNVGYPHIGFNIGGIAGTQRGYITECENYGEIQGRREVGGIVGQMEPAVTVAYTDDTLQILRKQLETLNSLIRQAEQNASDSSAYTKNQLTSLGDQLQIISDAFEVLIPHKDSGNLPDLDQIESSMKTVSDSIEKINKILTNISNSTSDAYHSLSRDIKAISNQIDAMEETLGSATDNLGGHINDTSDLDTPEDTTGKVSFCKNFGYIQGDSNTGGITGAIARENDLDSDKDFSTQGEASLNIFCDARAVILSCENKAEIFCKKHNGGGIVGWVSIGLVKDCANTGTVGSDSAESVGGIAGYSTGYLRDCNTKCHILGSAGLGGIAGKASVATGCRSCVLLPQGKELTGAILGNLLSNDRDVKDPLQNNYYLIAYDDMGAVDGTGYAGQAEPLSKEAFFQLENLPDFFRQSTLNFFCDDKIIGTVIVPFGEALSPDQIPQLPEKDKFLVNWDKQIDYGHIFFDQDFHAEYTPCRQTAESDRKLANGRPMLLAQGYFSQMGAFPVTESDEFPTMPDSCKAVSSWIIPVFSQEATTQLRFACEECENIKSLRVMVKKTDGSWEFTDTSINGSYLVFSVEPGETAFCVVTQHDTSRFFIISGIAVAAVILTIVLAVVICKRRKKRTAAKMATQQAETSDKTKS